MSSDCRDLIPLSLDASSLSELCHYGLASTTSPWSTLSPLYSTLQGLSPCH